MQPQSVEDQVTAKLIRSKEILDKRSGPLHVSVVFAMYKEHKRILSPEINPIGEDFVNVKIAQLRWLFDGDDGWDLVMVDDGCPDGSGKLAQGIIAAEGYEKIARVLFIADAIQSNHPVVAGLSSPDDSRKGGAIEYGMFEAAQQSVPGQIIVYTDADLSTHLGQIGLLVDALDGGASCAAASRREPESVVVKSAARNDRGKVFIYLWKQMLPQLKEIIDSQCGFKAFPADVAARIVMDSVEKKFAFDIELLLRCEMERPNSITRVPIAWIDSEAGSTTSDLEPYLPMLKAVARMYRRYSSPDAWAESFVRLIESMDQAGWERSVTNIPKAITDREPMEFSTWSGVNAEEMAEAAGIEL